MRWILAIGSVLALTAVFTAGRLRADPGPFDGKRFKGRIAYSADGNFNDEDDWAASPVALAIFERFGVKEKLVHFDYNNILGKTDPVWEKEHAKGVLGAAKRFGYPGSIFHDCRKDRRAAIESIKKAIDASSADDPLWFILAGPMEVPYLGIQASDPAKRTFVSCISHSRWNDGYASEDFVHHNKRHVIPSGIQWVQITDQNQFLTTSPFGRAARPEEWKPYHWMRDSRDDNVKFLWSRMQATTRADCSDAGMAYFLLTGDEKVEIAKLRRLLEKKGPPEPRAARKVVRIEAENFRTLHHHEVEHRNDRTASHRLSVKHTGGEGGHIETDFAEPYTAPAGSYDVAVRYFDGKGARPRFRLSVNGAVQGEVWSPSEGTDRWQTRRIPNVRVRSGDRIAVRVEGKGGRLDYLQFNAVPEKLDDSAALPGQVIVAGPAPGYLKYNGGGPVFLSGPDNPEDFLYRGKSRPDGTRTGGGQEKMIRRMARAGVNAFHCQMFRMKRCNIKGEGDDEHCPFVAHDPAKPLNEAVLGQWDRWLDLLEENGILVHLEFYNDATDVERMGWVLDAKGGLHPDERRWVEGIVQRFKHHKNILWGLAESCNKLPRERTAHFKKMAAVIARADDHHHPIVQSFVVPDDPEGDFPHGGVTDEAYAGDPHIQVVTWLHVRPHGEDFEKQHREYLAYYKRSAGKFVVLKNETYHHPRRGRKSRVYTWSCALTGMHSLEAYHHADDGDEATLADDGRLCAFLEKTDFYRMKPRDDLAAASTRWVLAKPGTSYIAYGYDCGRAMGLKGMAGGTYDLLWFDPVDGDEVRQEAVKVPGGEVAWKKPASMGKEVALYVKRRQ